jgi:thiosulfate/3-mercaptopyruvate sulfurtransferase
MATGVTAAAAQQRSPGSGRDALLVTPSWLATHLHDANLVLLAVGDPSAYAGAHIPGARFVALNDISVSGGLSLEMPPAEELRARLASLGISNGSRIVVYSAVQPVQTATRVVFTLAYAGLGDRTALLDGGLDAWTGAGNAVTNAVTPARAGQLSALSLQPLVVNAEYVRAHASKPHVSIVDARAAAFYSGAQTGRSDPPRAGHIAGAKSVPFSDITDAQSRLKSADQLAAIFTAAGVQPGDTVIGYCHIGQQATAMLLAAKSLGHPVLLYDGSFEDWARHADYPVTNPSSNKPQ